MSGYTIDTMVLIYLNKRYPKDLFPTLWERVEATMESGEFCICSEVHKELHRGGDDLANWASSYPDFIHSPEEAEFAVVADIATNHPDWVQGTQNAGDPFVVAHAVSEGSVIVTDERRKGPGAIGKNMKIPNVAAEHDVECVNFLALLRLKGWAF